MTALQGEAVAQGSSRLDLGRVIGRTFGAIGANFLTFFLLAMLLAALPSALIRMSFVYLTSFLLGSDNPLAYGTFALLIVSAANLVAAIPAFVLIGALTQGAIVHYNGGRASFGECLSTGLSRLLVLTGLGIVTFLGLILWFLPVLIPGLFLGVIAGTALAQAGNYLSGSIIGAVVALAALIPVAMAIIRWSVAAPALVAERTGIMAAFRRSGDLTRNNRWAIFLLALIWAVISFGIQWTVNFVGASALLNSADTSAAAGWLVFGFAILISSLNTMILATGQAAIYYELRVMKEGATSDELAKIFD